MIKRILVALDPDEDTPVATDYAAEMAGRFDAEVSGLAVVDTKHIATEVGGGGAVGGFFYAEQVRQHVTDRTRLAARDLADAFHGRLVGSGLRHGERVEDGVPHRRIVEDMKYFDLLVIGRDPHFFYRRPEQRTSTLAEVVKRGVIPTLVVGRELRPVQRVLLAYDGSEAAARTIQRFVQLKPFGEDLEVDLMHVRSSSSGRDQREGELLLRLMKDYLHAHGLERVYESSPEGGDPAARLLDYARHFEVDLIVAGAHGVSAVRRLAFGSTTHALLERSNVPLFVYH